MRTALYRRLALAAVLTSPLCGAPPGAVSAPDYVQAGTPNQAEGEKILAEFRGSGPAKPYYLEFELQQLPRRGPETTYRGRLWADRNEAGSILRIDLNPGAAGERHYLVQNGPQAEIWESEPGPGPAAVPHRVEALAPLLPGVEVAPFDLQMPYLYWPGARLVSVTRMRGRPAHLFVFPRPANFAGPAELETVRVYLDAQYHAPVRTELLTHAGRILKTFSLVDLKKVGADWIPEDIDARNESTHDKTRFSVTAAAMNVDPLPAMFSPENLPQPQAPPAARLLTRFAP